MLWYAHTALASYSIIAPGRIAPRTTLESRKSNPFALVCEGIHVWVGGLEWLQNVEIEPLTNSKVKRRQTKRRKLK